MSSYFVMREDVENLLDAMVTRIAGCYDPKQVHEASMSVIQKLPSISTLSELDNLLSEHSLPFLEFTTWLMHAPNINEHAPILLEFSFRVNSFQDMTGFPIQLMVLEENSRKTGFYVKFPLESEKESDQA